MKVYKEIDIDIDKELERIKTTYTKREQMHLRQFYNLFERGLLSEAAEHCRVHDITEYILCECYDVLWGAHYGERYIVI